MCPRPTAQHTCMLLHVRTMPHLARALSTNVLALVDLVEQVPMMNASARTPRRGRRNDSSSIGGHSHKDASLLSASTTCTSSERATTSAVAFEAFQ